jgi:hypothetical protein
VVDGFLEVFYAETVGGLSLGVNVNQEDLSFRGFLRAAPRLMVVVVFPTPPLWFVMDITRMAVFGVCFC